MKKAVGFVWVAIIAAIGNTLFADGLTTDDYVQDGLINQWDGIENAGVGTHNAAATVWKDLKGGLDLTLCGKGAWNATGNGLNVNGCSAKGTSATTAYRTIEVVYKMSGGRILFASGNAQTRFVLFDSATAPGTMAYFDGAKSTKYIPTSLVPGAPRAIAATYNESSAVDAIYYNGAQDQNGKTHKNDWLLGDGKVMIGDRSTTATAYTWQGTVYAIRLYDRELTAEEIAANCLVDILRFFPDDYRLAQDGSLECRFRVLGADGATVKVGEVDAPFETWVKVGNTTESFNVTVTPGASCAFKKWNLDAEAVLSSATSATVTVTPYMGVTLTPSVDHDIYMWHKNAAFATASNWKVRSAATGNLADATSLEFTSGNAILRIKSDQSGAADFTSGTFQSTDVNIYGIQWYRNWGTFDLKANGSAKIMIGAYGMQTVGNVNGDRTYYVRPKVEMTADQCWGVTNVLNHYEVLGGLTGNYTLETTGNGSVKVSGGATLTTDWPRTKISGGEFQLAGKANLLANGHEIVFNGGTFAATLNLMTFDQTLADGLLSETAGSSAKNAITTSGAASRYNLVFTGTPKANPMGFGGTFTGGAGITWNPTAADKVFVISKATSDTQGKFVVQNGTLKIADGAKLTSVSLVTVDGANARLEVDDTADAAAIAGSELVVANGGKVKVADGKKLVFDSITANGASLAGGVFTKDNATWIEGDGQVVVAGNAWTAGGGSDTSVETAANWGGATVDLTGSSLTAILAADGVKATIPSDLTAAWRGISFRGNNNFELAAEEGGSVGVAAAGVITTAGAAARTYTISSPLSLLAPQFWLFDTGDTVEVTGPIAGTAENTLNKDGSGRLNLKGANTFDGALNIIKGNVYLYGSGTLGSTVGKTTVTSGAGFLYLNEADTEETIVVSKGGTYPIKSVGEGPSYIRGPIDARTGGNMSIGGESAKAPLHVCGSIWGSGNFSGYNLVVDETPLQLGDRLSGSCTITFNVSSNWIGNNIFMGASGARIICNAPYALYRGPTSEKRGDGSTCTYVSRYGMNTAGNQVLDLGGYNQELNSFCVTKPSAASTTNVVRSATPAQLEIYCTLAYGDENGYGPGRTNNWAVFEGGAGFKVKRFGSASAVTPITLASVSSTTGRLDVAVETKSGDDTLILAGGWPKASAIGVTSGKLVLKHNQCIGKKTDVYVRPTGGALSGVLQLDNAQPQKCQWLYVWDASKNDYRQLEPGLYGGPDCADPSVPAANRLAGLAGTGVLNSLGHPGLAIFIR